MTEHQPATTVFVTASVAVVDAGQLLVVRKRGTDRFMLPGGKLEPGETALEAAVREAQEEVGLVLDPDDVEVLGHWRSRAANEPDAIVDSVVHVLERSVEVQPHAEIVELAWLPIAEGDLRGPGRQLLAPLTVEHVLPALRDRVAGDR